MKKNILGLCAFILCLLFLQAKSMEEIAAHHPDPAVAHEMVRILLPYVINPNPLDSISEQSLDQIMHQMDRRSIAQLIVEELARRGQVPMLVFRGFFMDQWGRNLITMKESMREERYE